MSPKAKPGWVIPHISMEIKLNIKNTENLTNMNQGDLEEMKQILEALVSTGGLTGVKGGQTIIHFDAFGVFQKIELKYFPWVRKSERKNIDTYHDARYT